MSWTEEVSHSSIEPNILLYHGTMRQQLVEYCDQKSLLPSCIIVLQNPSIRIPENLLFISCFRPDNQTPDDEMAAVKDISTLISNARSRAAILSSLDNAFEVPLSGVRKKPLNEVELSTRIHNDRDAFIDHLQELLRGAGIYSRQKIEDQIKGKTIVLQHMRSGSTNAMAKLKK